MVTSYLDIPTTERNLQLTYRHFRHGEEMTLEKMRVFAFIAIPDDATVEEARGWLRGQFPLLSTEAAGAICRVHAEDEILREWRVERRIDILNSVEMSDN